jgi:hypothetical protein
MQFGRCPGQKGHGRDGLAGSQLPPGTENMGQTAAGDLIEDQCKGADGQGDGAALMDHTLAVDPVKHGRLFSHQRLRLHHVSHRDDLENETEVVQARIAIHVEPGALELSSPVMMKPGTSGCSAMATLWSRHGY